MEYGTMERKGISTSTAQPAFLSRKTANQSISSTGAAVTVTWDIEVFDLAGNFTANQFTAPVTGKYQLDYGIRYLTLDQASTYYMAVLATSNRNYQQVFSTDRYSADPAYLYASASGIFDLDVGDTAYVYVIQQGGAIQTLISNDSYFSGHLVA